MNIKDFILGYLIGKGDGGGGSSVEVEPLTVTENGEYSEEGVAYSPVTVNVAGGGGGLEYEEGTWTPSADIDETRISFANSHTRPPFAFAIVDATGSNYASNAANMFEFFCDNSQIGGPINITASSYEYGRVLCGYKTGGGASIGQWYQQLTKKTTSGTAYRSDVRYWATNTDIGLYTGDPSQKWLASRTYKWIAMFITPEA